MVMYHSGTRSRAVAALCGCYFCSRACGSWDAEAALDVLHGRRQVKNLARLLRVTFWWCL